jgi:hypothetical protein
MGQCIALVGKQQHDVVGCGRLRFAQDKPQADTINLVRALTALQRVPWPPDLSCRAELAPYIHRLQWFSCSPARRCSPRRPVKLSSID